MAYTIPDNDLAAFPIQSQIFETDLSILAAAYAGYRVVSGCAVTAQGSPDMSVAVAAGVIRPGDATLVSVSADAALAIDAADATLWRLDLVSVAANGTVTHTAGTAASFTAVKPPALPAGHVALAFVTVPPAATVIDSEQIVDKRPFMASPEPIAPVAHGNLGATHTFDYAAGSAHEGTANAACTVTLAGPAGVQEQILEVGITEDGTGGHVNSFTWDPSIVWEGGVVPTLDDSPNAYNLLVFRSVDGGTTWYGFTKFGAVGPAGADGLGVPAGGTAGQVLAKIDGTDNNTHWVDEAGGGSGVLAAMAYGSGTDVDLATTTSGTLVDADATHAAITFTAPASGNVIVEVECVTGNGSNGAIVYFGLREGTTILTDKTLIHNAPTAATQRGYASFYLTGLGAGSHTYKFAVAVSTGTAHFPIGPSFGQLRMTVRAA